MQLRTQAEFLHLKIFLDFSYRSYLCKYNFFRVPEIFCIFWARLTRCILSTTGLTVSLFYHEFINSVGLIQRLAPNNPRTSIVWNSQSLKCNLLRTSLWSGTVIDTHVKSPWFPFKSCQSNHIALPTKNPNYLNYERTSNIQWVQTHNCGLNSEQINILLWGRVMHFLLWAYLVST